LLQWEKLFNATRRKDRAKSTTPAPSDIDRDEVRTEFERDTIGSCSRLPCVDSAIRPRFFPLEPNDSIRTRLTHSHESPTWPAVSA